jgi:hypothetical protein
VAGRQAELVRPRVARAIAIDTAMTLESDARGSLAAGGGRIVLARGGWLV